MFFVLELWFFASGGDGNDWVRFLFPFGCFFVIAPLMANLFQLNKEIRKWVTDNDTRGILQPWILKHGKTLYAITILAGSAFSAVELCDSHLFQLSIFCLNIPQRQKQIFKNKRIFSIVLLENIPQFCLQLIYLLFINTSAGTNIAFIAMIFSVASVILTLFEYNTKKFVFESEFLMVIKFKVESKEIQNMSIKTFSQRVSNKRNQVNHDLSKILSVNYHLIEQLKPISCSEGALIACHVRTDIQTSTAMDALQTAIVSQRLQKVCSIN